ncbi:MULTISPECIES: extracellular solute-binding protein [unclassified Beijerinckia]|uniref:extracellular solute-binding protein n=1 Tax=unclassified Beijerinckia TaxID=2638183 RepID=UPI0008983748|nr:MULTISPECIES: extracellular solute-binding protein [unclassified Beijerinckia]MDH7794846.1 iron(III) transport system substrate-binding protein [Beijerinckia sp. GAS462]SEB77573.1 iron(III) transport system substrate-binding protein [Beijerinckia sp. 28-YEA-48]
MRRLAYTIAMGTVISLGAVSVTLAQDRADLEAAKKEGKVVWYTSTPVETGQKIAKMFEAKYGVKVEIFRSGGSAILRRFLQEAQAKRINADLLTTSDPAAAAELGDQGMFVPFKPVNFDKIPDSAKDANGNFIAQRLNIITIYVRSDKMPAAMAPRTWDALLDPKYKGLQVMTDPSFTSLQLTVVGMNAKEKGWGYYEKLRQNDIMIVQSNQQVSDMIKRGERVIAAGALDSYAAEDRKDGHPIETIYPTDGTYVIPSPTSVVKGSPNPNAGKLLAEFMISDDVQKLFPEDGAYSARIDMPPPAGSPAIKDIKVIGVDYAFLRKQGPVVKKKFNEIFQ